MADLLNFHLLIENDGAGMTVLNESTHEIKLKFRPKARAESANTLIQGRNQNGQALGSRREKERIIGEVVIKVSEWRRMYTE